MKNVHELLGKKGRRMDHEHKNEQETKRARGLGRKTREDTGKEKQMTALRFQTGVRHQASLVSTQGLKK